MPAILVFLGILVAVFAAFGALAYVAWRGSKPSGFFVDAVKSSYDLKLPEVEINAYYDLKDRLYGRLLDAGGAAAAEAAADSRPKGGDADAPEDGPLACEGDLWVRELPEQELLQLKQLLVRRLVGDIDRLDQVQRDKPGNWKLWRGKLVSEQYWGSLCDAERLVSEEIDACLEEAEELEAGWREVVFQQAIQCWRMGKVRDMEKKVQKKAVVQQKKQKEKDEKRREVEARMAEEQKLKQERMAEKAMEQLLREEENQKSAKTTAAGKAKAAAKQKAKKK